MNEKANKIKVEEKWRNLWSGLIKEFHPDESDRVIAIVGPTFLDAQLKQLIANFMIDDETHVNELLHDKGIKPLGSFSARIEAAYCLGLISKEEYHDLDKIRGIRNDFAHKLDLSFTDQSVRDRCNDLKLPKRFSFSSPLQPSTPREFFIASIILLGALLTTRVFEPGHERCVVPNEIEWETLREKSIPFPTNSPP